jgi:hypothetical protein
MNHEIPLRVLAKAKEFVFSPLDFYWTEAEERVLRKIFTNLDKRVFFIYNVLPSNMTAVLMAMYSRMKNPRGIRGIFVDSFLPQVLVNFFSEFEEERKKLDNSPAAFLKRRKIEKLDDFISYSPETRRIFEDFLKRIALDVDYLQLVSQTEKMRRFLNTWLDKYGHKSIARPVMFYLCLEQISILAAKSIEWTRPGAGYIELSTRYVDMSGKDVYPIEKELAFYGVEEEKIERVNEACFEAIREIQGDNFNGPFAVFLDANYGKLMTETQLKQGIIGEICDVVGNLLPCSTLTSLGAGISGEALPGLLEHLLLDETPENFALAGFIIKEAEKVGASQFLKHLEISEWRKMDWSYREANIFTKRNFLPDASYAESLLLNQFKLKKEFKGCGSFKQVIEVLKSADRSPYDKLPAEFEFLSAVFNGRMSFRSWRDLQRMGFCTHMRGYVLPYYGFYKYTKPAPWVVTNNFNKIYQLNCELALEFVKYNVPLQLRQYPMALGNIIPFTIGANFREWEFCNWQRTKPTVNHEVRQIFLGFEREFRKKYPWWKDISRADMTPAYIFARGGSNLPLV